MTRGPGTIVQRPAPLLTPDKPSSVSLACFWPKLSYLSILVIRQLISMTFGSFNRVLYSNYNGSNFEVIPDQCVGKTHNDIVIYTTTGAKGQNLFNSFWISWVFPSFMSTATRNNSFLPGRLAVLVASRTELIARAQEVLIIMPEEGFIKASVIRTD